MPRSHTAYLVPILSARRQCRACCRPPWTRCWARPSSSARTCVRWSSGSVITTPSGQTTATPDSQRRSGDSFTFENHAKFGEVLPTFCFYQYFTKEDVSRKNYLLFVPQIIFFLSYFMDLGNEMRPELKLYSTSYMQCWRSVTFWYGSGCGSGSSDPYLWLTNPDADPGGPKTYGSSGSGFGTLVHLYHSSKIKSHKEVTKQ